MPGNVVEMVFSVTVTPDRENQKDQFHGIPMPDGFSVWGAGPGRIQWGYDGESRHGNPYNIFVEKAVSRLKSSLDNLEELRKHLETTARVQFLSYMPSFCCHFSPKTLAFLAKYDGNLRCRWWVDCKEYENRWFGYEETDDYRILTNTLLTWQWDTFAATDRRSVNKIVRRYASFQAPGVSVREQDLFSGVPARPVFVERHEDSDEDSDEFIEKEIDAVFCSASECGLSEALVVRRTNDNSGYFHLSGDILSRMVERGVALNFALFVESDYRTYSCRQRKTTNGPNGSVVYEDVERWMD
jgi:hypothetical protein